VYRELLIGDSGVFGSAYFDKFKNDFSIIGINRSNWSKLIDNSVGEENEIACINRFLKSMKISRVVYAAQHSDYRSTDSNNLRMLYEVNSSNLKKILLASRDLEINVTTFSSGSVYVPKQGPIEESDNLKNPMQVNAYEASKLHGELLANTLIQADRLITLRPFFLFGPSQKSQALIPNLRHRVLNGQEVILQGDHGMELNPIFVDDAVAIVGKLHDMNAQGTFNLAGSRVVSIEELAMCIGRAMNKPPQFTYVSGTPLKLIAGIGKVLSYTGTHGFIELETSISKTI
jgi:nucleoside-diphosphate-sugar epimerase